MDLSSLPPRPLTTRELAGLGESDAFVAVRPVERFEFDAVDETLVVAVVFVTSQGVRGAAFAPDTGWRVVHRDDRDGIEALGDVPESAIADAQRALRAEITDLEGESGFASQLVDAYTTHS